MRFCIICIICAASIRTSAQQTSRHIEKGNINAFHRCQSSGKRVKLAERQVDFLKMLYEKLLELHLKHMDSPDEPRFPRPSFKVPLVSIYR